MKIRALIIFVVLLIATITNAFDGKRKGFVLGGGIGLSPWDGFDWSDQRGVLEGSGNAIVFDLVAGHGFSEQDLILIDLHFLSHGFCNLDDLTMVHDFIGLTWRHHFGQARRSVFSQIGAGRFALSTFDTRRDHPVDFIYDKVMRSTGAGWGANLGLGCHVLRHFNISGNWWVGSFNHEDGGRVHQSFFDLTTSVLLF